MNGEDTVGVEGTTVTASNDGLIWRLKLSAARMLSVADVTLRAGSVVSGLVVEDVVVGSHVRCAFLSLE